MNGKKNLTVTEGGLQCRLPIFIPLVRPLTDFIQVSEQLCDAVSSLTAIRGAQ